MPLDVVHQDLKRAEAAGQRHRHRVQKRGGPHNQQVNSFGALRQNLFLQPQFRSVAGNPCGKDRRPNRAQNTEMFGFRGHFSLGVRVDSHRTLAIDHLQARACGFQAPSRNALKAIESMPLGLLRGIKQRAGCAFGTGRLDRKLRPDATRPDDGFHTLIFAPMINPEDTVRT